MEGAHPGWFEAVVSALAYSVGRKHAPKNDPICAPPFNDLARFVLSQWAQLPDYLRAPMKLLTLGYDTLGLFHHGRVFHQCDAQDRYGMIEASAGSRWGAIRDLVRYHESLGALALFNRPAAAAAAEVLEPGSQPPVAGPTHCQYAVIGSGPSGALTACLLAEAGRDVLLLEEGAFFAADEPVPFTSREMLQKYRNGGQTVALGADKIAYVEGRCAGGGSEINSGLYHRAPEEILDSWRKEFAVEGLNELGDSFAACERELSVSTLPRPAPPASLKLHEGASMLGWKSLEVPRWFDYRADAKGARQTMTRTYLPRFAKAHGRLWTNARAERLRRDGNTWNVELRTAQGRRLIVRADHVLLCAGAIQTPALLRRSGITRNIGENLALHPTVKIVARFKEPVNAPDMGVPVHQVKEFSPRLSFGCSVSTLPYAALGMMNHQKEFPLTRETWAQLANYYAMISPIGRGTVRLIPGFRDALVRYRLTAEDRRNLADGARKLGRLLLEAGATSLFPGVRGLPAIASRAGLADIPDAFSPGTVDLMTIHLFSSCPMGELKDRCATDSFGRMHGMSGISIHDASILCGPPGVNPQGTIMALARRNTLRLLGEA